MRLPPGKAAALATVAAVLAGCGATPNRDAPIAARLAAVVGQPVACSPTGDLAIWPEYAANTPLYSCAGSHRRWCVVEPPQPFRGLFRLHAVADVTGGMFAVFYRDAWNVRPSCLRWSGVLALASVGG